MMVSMVVMVGEFNVLYGFECFRSQLAVLSDDDDYGHGGGDGGGGDSGCGSVGGGDAVMVTGTSKSLWDIPIGF